MKRWLIATLLASLSVAALGPLIDNFDLSHMWRLQLNREGAIRAARQLAQQHGVDTQGWSALCRASFAVPRAYLERAQDRPPHPLFTPAQYDVLLMRPDRRRWVRLGMNAQGRPLSFQQEFAAGERLVPQRVAPSDLLALYAGAYQRSFQPENEGVEQSGNRIDSWVWGSASQFEASARLEMVDERGTLRSAKLELRLPADFTERFRAGADRQKTILATVGIIIISLAFTVAFPLFFRGLVRRWFPSRLLAPLYLCFAALAVLDLIYRVPQGASFLAAETFSSVWTRIQGNLLGLLVAAAAPMVLFGAGRSLASESDLLRWFSFEALLSRQFWLRPVGQALVGGVLCGCALAVTPFVALLAGTMPAPNLIDVRAAVSSTPGLAALANTQLYEVVFLMILLWPLRNWWSRRWVGWLIYVLAGAVAVCFVRDLYDHWLGHDLLAALAITIGFALVYHAFDLLAVLVAQAVMGSVTLAVALSFQPAGMRVDALGVMALPLGLLAVGGLLAWRGRSVDVPAEVARQRAELKEAGSDRDRLRGEFSVARKAQLGMLPEVPERIGGTLLAASCHPAREVGGDLYDFFECPDGRYAICVADVSGKGVPASLYMALTKGVMAAASVEGTPIPKLLATLNRHLLEFGKRKMFVTMALGYYDAATRTLEHARAGHNPVLVWNAKQSEASFLKPGGVGLGLAGARSFERTLRVETVTLEPDDLVVFYSDGIVEAMNTASDQFGEERLLEAVRDSAALSAAAVEQEISRRVRLFAGAAPVHDDQTLFVLRVG